MTGWKPSTSLPGSIASITVGLVDLVGKRQLDEDAVDGVVGVELGEESEQLVLGGVGGQPEVARVDADARRGLVLPLM